MIFKLFPNQQDELKSMPETGMGYQLIQARFTGEYDQKELIVLNEELVVENNYQKKNFLKEIFSKGFDFSVRNALYRELKEIKLINENKSFNVFNDGGSQSSSAKENPIIYPDGKSYYVRLSAYEDDKRIDKKNNCYCPVRSLLQKKIMRTV